jgi:hypothetical protein
MNIDSIALPELKETYLALEKKYAALERKQFKLVSKIKEIANDPEFTEPPKPPGKLRIENVRGI